MHWKHFCHTCIHNELLFACIITHYHKTWIFPVEYSTTSHPYILGCKMKMPIFTAVKWKGYPLLPTPNKHTCILDMGSCLQFEPFSCGRTVVYMRGRNSEGTVTAGGWWNYPYISGILGSGIRLVSPSLSF